MRTKRGKNNFFAKDDWSQVHSCYVMPRGWTKFCFDTFEHENIMLLAKRYLTRNLECLKINIDDVNNKFLFSLMSWWKLIFSSSFRGESLSFQFFLRRESFINDKIVRSLLIFKYQKVFYATCRLDESILNFYRLIGNKLCERLQQMFC